MQLFQMLKQNSGMSDMATMMQIQNQNQAAQQQAQLHPLQMQELLARMALGEQAEGRMGRVSDADIRQSEAAIAAENAKLGFAREEAGRQERMFDPQLEGLMGRNKYYNALTQKELLGVALGQMGIDYQKLLMNSGMGGAQRDPREEAFMSTELPKL